MALTRLPGWLGLAFVTALTVIVADGCPPARPLHPAQAAWVGAPVWLTTFDHSGEYLDAVVLAARGNPDSVIGFLGDALQNGPGVLTVRDYEMTLHRTHSRDSMFLAVAHPGYPFRPAGPYVADYLERLDRTWRVRAALALGRIAYVHQAQPAIAGRALAVLHGFLPDTTTVTGRIVLAAVGHALDTNYARDSLPHG